MTKTTSDIRASFLSYFEKNGHSVLPSSSLVPHNDPTLMFTAAGMVQFKNVFTGVEKVAYSRAATSQKCVRAGGKHNDLDNVGYTSRHHTFFEMLGNFSFGDYFKEEAIALAWELLTKEWGLSPEKLCVTVYHDDDFAWNTWKKLTGFADHKIIRINSNDNFWSAGDTGPCGPCSEIFYDHGEHIAGGPPGSPEQDGDRFTEIWNLVFMQYDQVEGGRTPLPKPSIDTGMGLERISAVLQGVHDNYDIDLFKALIANIEQESGFKINGSAAPQRVIADHLRSSCFLIADGVMPSNEGRGYVLRRIMRRAMRYAHQLGCTEPLMHKLVPSLVAEMGAAYPELARAQATITENLRAEEERFKETLGRGLKLLDEELLSSFGLTEGSHTTSKDPLIKSKDDAKPFSGETAFKLYDTYGFPLDLTQDILRGKNIEVDIAGFDACMERQKDMARASHKGSGDTATSKIWFEIKERVGATKFLGYEEDAANATVLAIVQNGAEVSSANAGDEVFVVLDQTPFYGESGGQVGDSGQWTVGGGQVAIISDSQKPLEDFIVHKALLKNALKVGDKIQAAIDVTKRNATRANHSATHLLHKALRDALGEHVTQKGSLVDSQKLRFDFSHGKAVSKEEIAAIEQVVNAVVWQGGAVGCEEMTPDAAIAAGAMALFGEKYGERVRVLSMGKIAEKAYSVELCGGTHVRDVADIGLFKITSEGSVASGIRRIEAVTGENVRAYMVAEIAKLTEKLGNDVRQYDELKTAPYKELHSLFTTVTSELQTAIEAQAEENKKRAKAEAEAKKQQALSAAADVATEMVGSVNFASQLFDGLDPKELRTVAEKLVGSAGVVCVATNSGDKISLVVAVEKSLSDRLSAVALVQAAVAELGGKGGGGKPELAQGGGPEIANYEKALAKIKTLIS